MNTTGLIQCPLFTQIKEDEIAIILKAIHAYEKQYSKGTMLYRHQDLVPAFGIVCEGCVQIIKQDYLGNNTIYADITPYGLFAESFALNHAPLQVDIIAGQDCTILWIPVQYLFHERAMKPSQSILIQNLMRILSDKNQFLTKRIDILSQRSTREKVMTYLYQQALRTHSSHIEISLNRQELADYLCVERSALSAVLSQLKQDGILEYQKNKFRLL